MRVNWNKKKMTIVVAIDGPVASGKTVIGKKLAKKLGVLFLDTGLMYRAVAWAVNDKKISYDDEKAVCELANNIKITINSKSLNDEETNNVYVDGRDVTKEIKGSTVNNSVSKISSYAGVREALTNLQRKIAGSIDVVMVGRDIGTVVLPNANYKFFLTASIEERAKRRFNEEKLKGSILRYEEVVANIKLRDEFDSNREIAPLRMAEDALCINTEYYSIDEVVGELLTIIKKQDKCQ